MKSTQLAMALLGRELRERYLSTFAGLAWVLITPVMLLAIYAFVFVELLGARFGNRVGGDVIAFLALGMWPWHAFADSLARGTSALTGNAALIGQIAIPRVWLVLVPTLGAALIHAASFVLGEARPGPSGGLPRVEFSRSDRQQVWFTRHDEACNPATPVPQPVKQSSWVASSLRPSGSPVNPHTLTQAESSTLSAGLARPS